MTYIVDPLQALSKFLNSIDWAALQQVQEAHRYLPKWAKIAPEVWTGSVSCTSVVLLHSYEYLDIPGCSPCFHGCPVHVVVDQNKTKQKTRNMHNLLSPRNLSMFILLSLGK